MRGGETRCLLSNTKSVYMSTSMYRNTKGRVYYSGYDVSFFLFLFLSSRLSCRVLGGVKWEVGIAESESVTIG